MDNFTENAGRAKRKKEEVSGDKYRKESSGVIS
jgi:hypothetical protein